MRRLQEWYHFPASRRLAFPVNLTRNALTVELTAPGSWREIPFRTWLSIMKRLRLFFGAISALRRTLGVCRRRRQRAQNPRPERRKIVHDRIPYRFDFHSVVAMPEPVADATDVVPRQASLAMIVDLSMLRSYFIFSLTSSSRRAGNRGATPHSGSQ